MMHIMKNKICLIDETKICDDCGECSKCLMDLKKECDNCGDCIKPQYLGARKITISNIEDSFDDKVKINELKKIVLQKENILKERFILHDVRDLRGDHIITPNKDYVEEEITKEEEDKLNKALEDFNLDEEVDDNGVQVEHIEDIEGLNDLLNDEENKDKYLIEEFPGLLKFDKDYRNKKNDKTDKKK
jgi:hypothetical protein